MRNFLYRHNLVYVGDCASFVISIGNISWGGTGKTSLVIKLATYFSSRSTVAILRRGYGRDEELLLRDSLPPDIRIFSAKNRLSLAQKAAGENKVIILDDGFQYRRLKRDLDIILLNASQDLNSACLPAGPLREPLSSIKRADIIIVKEFAGRDKKEIADLIKSINASASIYFASYRLKRFVDIKNGTVKFIKEAAVLTAIGWPEGFISFLKKIGIELREKFIYPDHSSLSYKEWQRVENVCRKKDINNLVITAKDRARIYPSDLNVVVAEAEFAIEAEEDFFAQIENEFIKPYF